MTPTFTTGADLLGSWFADVERGDPPVRYSLPPPFASLDLRPGRLVLFGGAPGGGKTAALLQVGIDLLRLNDAARLLVANVEMVPQLLVERIVSRLSRVPLTAIADRTLTPDQLARVRGAVTSLAPIAGRLAFLHTLFALEHVAAAGSAFGADVLMLDYIQRFTCAGKGDRREQLETAAAALRRFCDAGAAVLVASAVARQRGKGGGSSYVGLTLASFRGSSELEYGADAAYLLTPADGGIITFSCEKSRYAAAADIVTRFTPAPARLDAFDTATPAPTRGTQAKGESRRVRKSPARRAGFPSCRRCTTRSTVLRHADPTCGRSTSPPRPPPPRPAGPPPRPPALSGARGRSGSRCSMRSWTSGLPPRG